MRSQSLILIADDDAAFRRKVSHLLDEHGYPSVQADTGRQTLQAIQFHSPSLVLLDLVMPDGDGFEVLEMLRIRQTSARPKIIVLSAHAAVPLVVQAMQWGASDFLEKGSEPAEWMQKIDAAFGKIDAMALSAREQFGQLLKLAKEELARHNWSSAGEHLERASQLGDRDPELFNLLGTLHEAEGHRRLAKKFYTKSIRLDAAYQPALANLRRLKDLATRYRQNAPRGVNSDL